MLIKNLKMAQIYKVLGLICLAINIVGSRFFRLTDFLQGFFVGLSIVFILASLFYTNKAKKGER